MTINATRSNLRNQAMRQGLRRMLYPWHRRQRRMWEIAAEVDVDTLLTYVFQSRDRRPALREYSGSIWTPKEGRYGVLRG